MSLIELQQNQHVHISIVSGFSVSVCLLWWGDTLPPLHLPATAVQPPGLPLACQLQHGPGAVHSGWDIR